MSAPLTTRRDFLNLATSGVTGVALAQLLAAEAKTTHFPAKAKRVLHIVCPGAASHIDLWDHKPELDKRDGQALPGAVEFTFQGKNLFNK